MTDAGSPGTEWVPRFGMLEVPRERAELIRGLFELAAWVADHPEFPLPAVDAGMFPRRESLADEFEVVDRVAAALEVAAEFSSGGGHYRAERMFGPVRVYCLASTPEHRAAFAAHMSYRDSVQPEPVAGASAGGAR